jgi:hypothetical protein
MNKYRVRLKVQINFIKDIEIEATDKDIAYRISQDKAGDMLVNCIKAVKEKDKNILNNMSYYDTTKPKEV